MDETKWKRFRQMGRSRSPEKLAAARRNMAKAALSRIVADPSKATLRQRRYRAKLKGAK